LRFEVWIKKDKNNKYIADATRVEKNEVEWVVITTATTGNPFDSTIYWVIDWFVWLIPWMIFYLQDNWGVGITPWTTTIKIWRAISTTEINFLPPM
jgi:hypothetical protein